MRFHPEARKICFDSRALESSRRFNVFPNRNRCYIVYDSFLEMFPGYFMNARKLISAVLLIVASGVSYAQDIKSVDDLKAEAAAVVEAISVDASRRLLGSDTVVFVDVRESDEIERSGQIEGAVHVPRGVLEFYIDSKSSMHMDIFSSGKKIIFYCATGGRSLLAAKVARDMGVKDPVYLDGGFKAWSEANADKKQ